MSQKSNEAWNNAYRIAKQTQANLNSADAEDRASEIAMRMWEQAHKGNLISTGNADQDVRRDSTYASTIARRLMMRDLETKKREAESLRALAGQTQARSAQTPGRALEVSEQIEYLERLASLDAQVRTTLDIMRGRCTVASVAASLGTSERQVYRYMLSAIKRMREALQKGETR